MSALDVTIKLDELPIGKMGLTSFKEQTVTIAHDMGHNEILLGEAWPMIAHAQLPSPALLVLNKADAMTPRELSARRAALAKASGRPVFVASGVSREGVPEIVRALMTIVRDARAERAAATPTNVPA